MSSVPYSRYIVYPVPWYSFLIVLGVALALFLACREEKRSALPKDTFIDLALWLLPFGILGARLYYVIFSWSQFSGDLLSVIRVWEGGLAIYGGVIAGLIVLVVFSRVRKLSLLSLCDAIAPGLVLAQCIGRWGNWFNIEAYGLRVTDPSLCFFPFALQVPEDGYAWHLATFFYESLWNFLIFVFLIRSRRGLLRRTGDVFFFYLLLYAAGRLVIEELRLDSLYAGTAVRVSQLVSMLVCTGVVVRYACSALRARTLPVSGKIMFFLSLAGSVPVLVYALGHTILSSLSAAGIAAFLSAYALLMILSLFFICFVRPGEVSDADN